jgi:hypothetical protein
MLIIMEILSRVGLVMPVHLLLLRITMKFLYCRIELVIVINLPLQIKAKNTVQYK